MVKESSPPLMRKLWEAHLMIWIADRGPLVERGTPRSSVWRPLASSTWVARPGPQDLWAWVARLILAVTVGSRKDPSRVPPPGRPLLA